MKREPIEPPPRKSEKSVALPSIDEESGPTGIGDGMEVLGHNAEQTMTPAGT
jgi:hypothetical protein